MKLFTARETLFFSESLDGNFFHRILTWEKKRRKFVNTKFFMAGMWTRVEHRKKRNSLFSNAWVTQSFEDNGRLVRVKKICKASIILKCTLQN